KSTGLERDPQRFFRLAAGLVLRAIEPREMLADDLLWQIPFELLSARVPAQYNALGVDHVDRVIGDALKQQISAAESSRNFCHVSGCPSRRAEASVGWMVPATLGK